MKDFESIDAYIQSCPEKQQGLLQEMKSVISNAAPEATESINYGMPTFRLNGNLVHFASAKNHLGFYPGPSAIVAFKDELTTYKTSKGAIQFHLDRSLPVDLITAIVQFRIKEQQKQTKVKSTIKS